MTSVTGGPVFVAGLERSGTSLLYAVLASHPNIAMTRRTNLWTYFYDQFGDLSDNANFERCLGMMMRYKRLVKLAPEPDRIAAEFRQGEASYARLFAILEEHHAERLGKPRWGDKSLNTERYADAIFAGYPDARILHMIRDPRDRYASVQTRWQSRFGGTGAGMAEWLSSAKLAKINTERYRDQYMVVRYEELATDPEAVVRTICEFIGESYDPAMLTMDGAAGFRDQGGNSSYGARPVGVISTDSIGRFRTVLSPPQINLIETVARSPLQDFGYELDRPKLSSADRLRFLLIDLPLELARLTAWRIRRQINKRRSRPLPDYRLVPEWTGTQSVDIDSGRADG